MSSMALYLESGPMAPCIWPYGTLYLALWHPVPHGLMAPCTSRPHGTLYRIASCSLVPHSLM